MMFPVAILAGGLATRLRPLTLDTPKALIPVAGVPFIVRQLGYLRDQGITQVVLCIAHLGSHIQSVVGDGSSIGIEVKYSPDGPTLLGTGGAIQQALPLLGENFFVLYGDSFLPINFASVQSAFLEKGHPALMTVLENQNRWDTSNAAFQAGMVTEYNKRQPHAGMSFIDYGLGILSRALFSEDTHRPFDLADLYHQLSLRRQLAGYEVSTRFYEIGSHAGLKEAETYFSSHGI